ncbi:hypothetical protein [Hydrogenophaga sp.]|nr:hypothetical protein [Hydrogenophaga sp.]
MQVHNATVLITGAKVLGDEITQQVKRGLSAEPGVYLRNPTP